MMIIMATMIYILVSVVMEDIRQIMADTAEQVCNEFQLKEDNMNTDSNKLVQSKPFLSSTAINDSRLLSCQTPLKGQLDSLLLSPIPSDGDSNGKRCDKEIGSTEKTPKPINGVLHGNGDEKPKSSTTEVYNRMDEYITKLDASGDMTDLDFDFAHMKIDDC